MQIVAVTDPLMLGFSRQTMIGIKCGGDLEQVADQLAAMDEIDYVVITAGSFDLLVEVVCEDDEPPAGDPEPGARGTQRDQHRDVRVPEAPQADLRLGDQMTTPSDPYRSQADVPRGARPDGPGRRTDGALAPAAGRPGSPGGRAAPSVAALHPDVGV